MSPVEVLLDISLLGAATDESRRGKGISGIYRVIERLTDGLAHTAECRLTVCAGQNQRRVRAYHKHYLTSSGVRFAPPRLSPVARFLEPAVLTTEKFCAEYYVRHNGKHFPAIGRVAWAACRFLLRKVDPAEARAARIYHATSGTVPTWVRRYPHLRVFATVYDLIPIRHPEFFHPQPIRHAQRQAASFTPDDWALCISESTRRDLLAHSRCDPARAVVVPLAADARFHLVDDGEVLVQTRVRYGIPPEVPYFLSVCTLEPRKNLDAVIRAFVAAARAGHIGSETRLVLVGDMGWMTEKILAAHSASGEIRERIVFTGFVADEDLAALYSGAQAFVYMSLYEGFGLPPLEAMSCGVPVVTSNNSSLPEVVGDAGILLDAHDGDGLAEVFGRLDGDVALRTQLAARSLTRASRFSWDKFLHGTLAAYRLASAS